MIVHLYQSGKFSGNVNYVCLWVSILPTNLTWESLSANCPGISQAILSICKLSSYSIYLQTVVENVIWLCQSTNSTETNLLYYWVTSSGIHWHLGVYIRRQSCWSYWLLILYRSVLWTYCLEFRCKKVKHSGHRMKGYYRTIWATEDRLIMFCSLFCKKKKNYFMTKTLNLLPYRG